MTEQNQPRRKRKAVAGRVTKVDTEKNLFWLKPRNADVTRFRYRPENLKVTMEGQEAGLQNIEKGQQAEVTFLEKDPDKEDKWGVSRAVKLNLRGSR